LVINNGGTHPPSSNTQTFTTYNFVVGNTYDFDLFYCERHTPGAAFSIWTNIYFGEPSTYQLTTVVPSTTLPPNAPPANFSYVPLPVTFHDFKFSLANFANGSNPDFQNLKGIDNFIVTDNLSPDWWLPVYYYPYGVSATTHGPASFNQWYTAGWIINGITLYLTLNASNVWVYDNPAFFLLDGQGWGNQGQDINGVSHNFAFCLTAHATFTYTGIEWFELASDDDAFLYINGELLIEQGGTHSATYSDVTLSPYAIGEILDFDLFYCERHTPGASLHLATNAFLGPATCQWNY
jgi:fibro-slime domain-containing protein